MPSTPTISRGVMYKCDYCNKEFETKQGLGVHKSFHKNLKLKQFEDLKKDESRKSRLLDERGHKCEICKSEKWMEKKIPLELDHIDGNPGNNKRENLRLVCPNCHAQTPYYRGANVGRNKNTKRQEIMSKYPDYRKQKIMGC